MILLPKQKTDWDCGIAAAEYFLRLTAPRCKFPSWEEAVTWAGSTPKGGTSPMGILSLVQDVSKRSHGIYNEPITDVPFPALINYQQHGDGHWGVLLGRDDLCSWVFDPFGGVINIHFTKEMSEWFYSDRYGKNVSVRE